MADKNDIFLGLDASHGEDSIPQGYYVEFTNVDSYLFSVLRPRPGLERVSPATFGATDIIVSGTLVDTFDGTISTSGFSKMQKPITPAMLLSSGVGDSRVVASGNYDLPSGIGTVLGSGSLTQDFSALPASGAGVDGSAGSFDLVVLSGLFTNHTASGAPAQIAKDGSDQLWGMTTGNYASGSLFLANPTATTRRGRWCMSQVTQSGYGKSVYSRATSVSGYEPDDLNIGIGVAAAIQPENEAWYHAYVGWSTFGGYPFIWAHMSKTISGIQTFDVAKSFIIGSGTDADDFTGEIRIEVYDNGDGTCDVKSYWKNQEAIVFTDNGASGMGFPLVSGLVGIGGENEQSLSQATWNYLTEWDGGSTSGTSATRASFVGMAGGAHELDSTSGTMGTDQYAELEISGIIPFNAKVGEDAKLGPAIRVTQYDGALGQGYYAGIARVSSTGAVLRLEKVLSASGFETLAEVAVTGTWENVQFVQIQNVGSTLQVSLNGEVQITHVDSSPYTTTGTPGVLGEFQIQNLENGLESGQISSWAGDNFEGGSLSDSDPGTLGILEPSGYLMALAAFSPFDTPSYIYVDASGSIIVLDNPERDV